MRWDELSRVLAEACAVDPHATCSEAGPDWVRLRVCGIDVTYSTSTNAHPTWRSLIGSGPTCADAVKEWG